MALKALKLERARRESGNLSSEDFIYAYAEWVRYILTTANTWRTPIKDFELIVVEPETTGENPRPKRVATSLCWDGSVQRVDKDLLVGRRTNFIPTRELAVYYFLDYD